MANRQRYDFGHGGGSPEGEPRRVTVPPAASRALLFAANDNKAPLPERLRRLVVLTMASAAVGWLFWVGLIR